MTEADLKALHSGAVRWARSCTGYDDTEAQEVMQAVYIKILEGRARYDGRSSLRTWLYSVIRNTAIARGRTRRRRAQLWSLFSRQKPEPTVETESAADRADVRRTVWAALVKLPARQRTVVELVFYRDFTLEEAASVMGISVGTARTHYARAKAKLSEQLKGERHR